MCLQRLMVVMLLATAEADAEQVGLGAAAVEKRLPAGLLEPGTERGPEEAQARVGTDAGAARREMPYARAELLQRAIVETRLSADGEQRDGVAQQLGAARRGGVRVDHREGCALVEKNHRRRKEGASSTPGCVRDPYRDECVDAGGDVDEHPAAPQRAPQRDELRLVDRDAGERALRQLGVAAVRLLECGDDDSLRKQSVGILEYRIRAGCIHGEGCFRRRARAVVAHGRDHRGIHALEHVERLEVESADVGAPPVLITCGRWHRQRGERIPRCRAPRCESRRRRRRQGRDKVGPQQRWGPRRQASGHYPTAPSMDSASRRLSSTAYSIGSSFTNGSKKPLTMSAVASCSLMPRDVR